MTNHKQLIQQYLWNNYEEFFSRYNRLLESDNYITKRQSLKLLGELLFDRNNIKIMEKYVNNVENLKRMMNLLREKSKSIQFEAFHVFKIFLVNPKKNKAVNDILLGNKEKIIIFLEHFEPENENEKFLEEKQYIFKCGYC